MSRQTVFILQCLHPKQGGYLTMQVQEKEYFLAQSIFLALSCSSFPTPKLTSFAAQIMNTHQRMQPSAQEWYQIKLLCHEAPFNTSGLGSPLSIIVKSTECLLACSSLVAWLKRTASSSRLLPPTAPPAASSASPSSSALGPACEADSSAASSSGSSDFETAAVLCLLHRDLPGSASELEAAAVAAVVPCLLRRDLPGLVAVAEAAGSWRPDSPAVSVTDSVCHLLFMVRVTSGCKAYIRICGAGCIPFA